MFFVATFQEKTDWQRRAHLLLKIHNFTVKLRVSRFLVDNVSYSYEGKNLFGHYFFYFNIFLATFLPKLEVFVFIPENNSNQQLSAQRKIYKFERAKGSSRLLKQNKIYILQKRQSWWTTVASINLQIATHYRKHEIFEPGQMDTYIKQGHSNIGYLFFHDQLDVPKTKKVFPKHKFLWISTVRNVPDQINSFLYDSWVFRNIFIRKFLIKICRDSKQREYLVSQVQFLTPIFCSFFGLVGSVLALNLTSSFQ